ncbi:Defective in cullin neddylation protein [Mycena venus]|uniref:Defective in cullin neddylation protein n=1 Tax=Mycena venus TaxID=2733690 RepID=A0A8H6Z2H2_9AGAR|nr:Defective in cullin neddylation protein [Mycena venus]
MRVFEFLQRGGGSDEPASVTITRNNTLNLKLVWSSSSGTTWAVFVLCTALLYRFFLRPYITPPNPKMVDRKMEENIAQFCGVTGASVKDAKKFLEKYKRVDVAIDAYYGDPAALASPARPAAVPAASTSKLNSLFDKYKDPHSDDITVDGTIKLCEDLAVDPEDVVLLAVAFELKSPRVGEWNRPGWIEGWKNIGCDSIPAMKTALPRLRTKLGQDPAYFQKVYNHTFEFAKQQGQRSIGIDTAQAFWALLLPHGMAGGALSHVGVDGDGSGDVDMDTGGGWKPEYVEWWFEFLQEKGGKGVSKDTWVMFLDFVRTIDAQFKTYDLEAAWPSTIDDFVEWAKERVKAGA